MGDKQLLARYRVLFCSKRLVSSKLSFSRLNNLIFEHFSDEITQCGTLFNLLVLNVSFLPYFMSFSLCSHALTLDSREVMIRPLNMDRCWTPFHFRCTCQVLVHTRFLWAFSHIFSSTFSKREQRAFH